MISFFGKMLHREQAAGDGLFSVPNRRNFTSDLVPDPGSADPLAIYLTGDAFTPEESYFSVRLVEMRMAEAGNYVSQFLPMCSCFLRYRHGNSVREVPYIVSYDSIRKLLAEGAPDRGGQRVEFKNIYIVRDAPVKADGLVMYTALCRIADSTFAQGMLDLVGATAGALGGPAVGLVAGTGVDLIKRLGAILGANGVSTRFGIYDGAALNKSCYRVFAGAGLDAAELQVDNGKLLARNAQGSMAAVDDVDYLVIALEYRKTLLDQPFGSLSGLPFHARWTEVTTRLAANDPAGAGEAFRRLASELVISPDLIEADRLGLLTSYMSQLEKWRHAMSQLNGAVTLRAGTRNLSASLNDVARTMRSPNAAVLMKSVSNRVVRYGASGDAASILSEEALSGTAQLMRVDIHAASADPATVAKVTSELAAAAYAVTF